MPIRYKYVAYKSHLSNEREENRVRPQLVSIVQGDTDRLVRRIVNNNYYSRPDAYKAVWSVFCAIEQLLRDGETVTVDSFGTFMLTAQYVKDNIDNNDPELKNKGVERRAENIEVKNVIFRALPEMKIRLGYKNFERIKK